MNGLIFIAGIEGSLFKEPFLQRNTNLKLNFMKLRIKGNSIRFRLSKSEVSKLSATGYLEEQTSFGDKQFVYALQTAESANELYANLDLNKMTMFVPNKLVKDWPDNNVVGFDASIALPDGSKLFLLLEKDFACLDHTTEDQSDNYENPNKVC